MVFSWTIPLHRAEFGTLIQTEWHMEVCFQTSSHIIFPKVDCSLGGDYWIWWEKNFSSSLAIKKTSFLVFLVF
jgi:hypothetical protein